MKATDDGYPFIMLGYMVGPKVVMMGSLKPHTDVHGMFPTLYYVRIHKCPFVTNNPREYDAGRTLMSRRSI